MKVIKLRLPFQAKISSSFDDQVLELPRKRGRPKGSANKLKSREVSAPNEIVEANMCLVLPKTSESIGKTPRKRGRKKKIEEGEG